jgi:hypothetical protein
MQPLGSAPFRWLLRYSGLLRPLPPLLYFRPRGVSACDFSIRIGGEGSHVPYQSLCKVHAAFMPVTIGSVIRLLPDLSQANDSLLVLMDVPTLSTLCQRFTCVRLPYTHLTESCSAFFSVTLTTMAFGHSSLRWFEAST